ncbi:peptide deformylase [Acidisoma cellulosilytica]|uniref:Peptide deformylase n=1 Tax=Acidisoma cellulosilyticum TaxID=2802395 RepID=A0A964E3U9_9PROT|nr:peptide deformylase [Acidisoma cellulosilyticum]MCB8880323.1 peptide deformylase [Acidisoma cellulosilyticum]
MTSDKPDTADLLPIVMAPDPRLKAKTRLVTEADRETLRRVVPRMFATMYAAPGIGLAAPQVGLDLRLAVIDLQPDDKPAPITLINPKIEKVSEDHAIREEGCLSIPGQYANVTRPAGVTVSYEDMDGNRQVIEADGLLATCLQHEIDHLDGVLFVDHLSALKRNMILRKMVKEKRLKKSS